jgi:hypothetical protein
MGDLNLVLLGPSGRRQGNAGAARGLLKRVDGARTPDEVFAAIQTELEAAKTSSL